MKKQSKTIWRVKTGDQNYSGHNFSYLLSGDSAATVEAKARKLHKRDAAVPKTANPSLPYTCSIELVGDLDD